MKTPCRLDPAALDEAFACAGRQVADGIVPFVVLAVADRRDLVRLEAFAGPSAPRIHVDAICLLASITKPIVATGVMQLVADGQVALTDSILRYIPESAAPGLSEVTIWHLLSHTSGIPDVDLRQLLLDGVRRVDLMRLVSGTPPRFPPGSRYEYASSTYDLLAAVFERVTGESHPVYLRRAIFEPLGMVDTTFDPWDRLGDRVAPLAASAVPGGDGPWGQMPLTGEQQHSFSELAPAGAGLFGTARDLVRFGRAMLCGGELDGARILASPYVTLMTREQTTGSLGASPDPLLAEHYALGWGKPDPRTSPASSAAFGHGGITLTRLWIDPEHDLVFVYLSGIWDHAPRPVDLVLQAVYGALR